METIENIENDTESQVLIMDIDAWEAYPKLNWVYNACDLFDDQKIKWSPFPVTDQLTEPTNIFRLDSFCNGTIYTAPIPGDAITTTAVCCKGVIKWLVHHNDDGEPLENTMGDLKLRMSAFVLMHLSKFGGVVTFETIGHYIVSVKLRLRPELVQFYEDGWLAKVDKLYKKKQWPK